MNIRTTAAGGLLIGTMMAGMALPQTAAAHGTGLFFGFNIGAPVVRQPAYVPAYVETVPAYQPYYPYGYYVQPSPVRYYVWPWSYSPRHDSREWRGHDHGW
ncbi:MAG TPA: hypothetical protein VMH34_00600 [Gammaproteobacteria bacterium]|nr:hypothetical protein [Gammaproteobacteria bacterium]